MKISYDKATDSLYIHLADRASVDSDEIKDGVVLDFDANGALVALMYNTPANVQTSITCRCQNCPLVNCRPHD